MESERGKKRVRNNQIFRMERKEITRKRERKLKGRKKDKYRY
jgi:hypothetical protein